MSARYELREHIAIVTLSDPDRRNALSRAIVTAMLGALARAAAEAARAIVVAGDGKAFCSGANMGDLRDGWMDGTEPETDPVRLFRALAESPLPVIAAVHGPALGGGFELAMCCDLVVASGEAWFALPELGHGVIPNTALARLPQLVGTRRTLEIMLAQERLCAAEALAIGIVNRIVPAGTELQAAITLARSIAARCTPGALAVAKRHLRQHHPVDWEAVRSSLHEVPGAEWQEGLDAYAQRRPVDYERLWKERAS